MARTAVKIGLPLMMKLAGACRDGQLAEIEQHGVKPDEDDAAECEAPGFRP